MPGIGAKVGGVDDDILRGGGEVVGGYRCRRFGSWGSEKMVWRKEEECLIR
jgi:hypothetical protein